MSSRTAHLFWNLIARKYAKTPISDIDAYQFKIDLTQQYLKSTDSVLEIGSGSGATAFIHAPYVQSYLGLDYSKKMVEISYERLRESVLTNLSFEVGSFQKYAFSKKFNVILALNFLHLSRSLSKNLNRCYSLLEDGGYLITSTSCFMDNKSPNYTQKLLSQFGFIPHINFFSAKTLESRLEEAGFKVLESHRPGKDQNVVFIIAQK